MENTRVWSIVPRLTCAVYAMCAAMVLFAGSAASLHAQVAHAVRMIGVYDAQTGEPIQGVQVRDAFSGSTVVTSSTGTARLDFITYRGLAAIVELRKLGYEAKQVVVAQDTASITELLTHATQLAPIVTTETYRLDRDAGLREGFEQRCAARSVTCFRDDDISKHLTGNVADLLVHADGITLGACTTGGTISLGRGGVDRSRATQCGKIAMKPLVIPPAYCTPTIFVDGHEWLAAGGPSIDLTPGQPSTAPFGPALITKIEVYPPEKVRPLRFQGSDPTCGAVVIWTK